MSVMSLPGTPGGRFNVSNEPPWDPERDHETHICLPTMVPGLPTHPGIHTLPPPGYTVTLSRSATDLSTAGRKDGLPR